MDNEEIRERFTQLENLLIKSLADQHILTVRLLSHQQALVEIIKELLVKSGQDRTMLNQRLQSAYRLHVDLFHGQLDTYLESGDAKALLNAVNAFPDQTQGN